MKYGHEKWVELWKGPVLDILMKADGHHVSLLNKYFLPLLSKESPSVFTDVWQQMANNVISKRDEKALPSLLTCLSIANMNGVCATDRILPVNPN